MNKRFKERNERNMTSKRRNVDNSIAARVEQAYIVNQNRWLQANSNDLLNATENAGSQELSTQTESHKWTKGLI